MSLFKKHLATLTKRVAEDLDDMQMDPEIDNDENDMPITTEASLDKSAEDDADDDKDEEMTEAAFNLSAEDDEDEVDDVVEAVADEVEDEIEAVVAEVKAMLKKAKASPKVAAAVIEGLRGWGFLMKQPFKVDLKKATFNKKEEKFIRNVVMAAKEAAEDILKAASYTLVKHNKTTKHAKQLDQVLLQDGFIRSRIASPLILGQSTVKKAEQAVKKTRKARRTIKK